MKEAIVIVLLALPGCALFLFRRPIGLAAERIGFPPFFTGDQAARIRLFGMIGLIQALIVLSIGGLFILSRYQ